ncbi:MAG TPA: phosphate acyltransferase PlsX [Oscillospiraceae bacterium]|nr:phosphate acyltransferase PlsX [Oscillospiraceae bacterium]HPK36529.1 phosphate acyltransferase PlsX [Oscillospiraceae bacterium]HPR76721.1 phosphate acyltransferase PlsX [Oscillospiraceae bacterium]
MRILLDCFGGDNAPDEVIKGARAACDEFGSKVILIGDKNAIAESAERLQISLNGLDIAHASEIFDMDEDPRNIVKAKPDSSMAVGLKMLAAGEGDAFLSAGSTGGLVMGASLLVGRIEGVKRPALAVAIPHPQGCYLLLDAGANLECRPEHLRQFAVMGAAYQKKVFSVPNPRVCLVNVGKEDTKGTPVVREAYGMLKELKNINFCGNVEARELPVGGCDVAVADGFTGNMILKLSEGLAGMLFKEVKKVFVATSRTKIAAALVTKQFRDMANRFDYSEYGGTPLLGIAKPVIKAHGSSKWDAFKNAIKKAEIYAGTGVIEDIASKII